MLSGTYSYGMDRKGRVVMPKEFRNQLGAPFILTRAPGQYLLALGKTQWESLVQRYESSLLFRGFYLAAAVECAVDETTGRFLVPHVLREYSELRPMDEVAIFGIGRAVQVARRDRWEKDLEAGDFPGLGQLDLDLALPRPVESLPYEQEVKRMMGVAVIRCQGKMQQRGVRKLIGSIQALLEERHALIVLDLRNAGETNPGMGLVYALTRAQRLEQGVPLWIVTEEELPPEDGVSFFRTVEDAFWRLDEVRMPVRRTVREEAEEALAVTLSEVQTA